MNFISTRLVRRIAAMQCKRLTAGVIPPLKKADKLLD